MNIAQDELNAWAQTCAHANARCLAAQDALRHAEGEKAQASIEEARQAVAMLWRKLERAGAESPMPAFMAEQIRDRALSVPLDLLDSPANRRYARLLRETWEALKEVEQERSIQDGASEVLEDWLVEVEEEIYGPAGVRE